MIAIVDYDAGNIRSVEKAIQSLGEEVIITRSKEEILHAEKVILPGVGAFGEAMKKLRSYELDEVLLEVVERKIPLLGICLGLQLLFEYSEESPDIKGLGILKGKILRIPECQDIKIPHIGWNSLKFPNKGILFDGIEEDAYVYFVHSYYLKAENDKMVTATTEYSAYIHAAVEYETVYACQFHPEKSSETGLRILQNFIQLNRIVKTNVEVK